jgi:hypothetical protein
MGEVVEYGSDVVGLQDSGVVHVESEDKLERSEG